MLVGLCHGRLAVPVHRHDRLPDRAPAGVPRGRARARARDRRRRGATDQRSTSTPARTATTRSSRAFLRCPSCLRRLKEPCSDVRQAARPALEDLPVLRGRGGPGARPAPPARTPASGRRPAKRRPASSRASPRQPRSRDSLSASRARRRSRRQPQRQPAQQGQPQRQAQPQPARPAGTTPTSAASAPSRAAAPQSARPPGRPRARTHPTQRGPLPDGQDPDPGQARCLRARPDRRDHRPLREQGAEDRRAEAHDRRPRDWPSSTTPSTRTSRSSATWWTSSPAARWWPWCWRVTRR